LTALGTRSLSGRPLWLRRITCGKTRV